MLRAVSRRGLSRVPAMARKNHSYVADPNATPLLRYQQSLPSLPVPPLQSTIQKYIETVEPLLTPAQLARTKTSAAEFLASPQAATLQARLQERADAVGDNWLSAWWNDAAYMGYRDPVVVFVSYFFVHLAHPSRSTGPASAAQLIKALLPFRALVESGTLEPEKVRGAPLCMASYKWLFHACRYPAIPSDTATKFAPEKHNHIVVLRKNRFFVVPLTHPATGAELSAAELELQFQRIRDAATERGTPIGALTSDNRDRWTHARERLMAIEGNEEKARLVESAMIVVCLDDTAPVTREEVSWGSWVGDGRNRWYDKHQLIVYENGRSAFLGEHSCMDGTPTLRMNEFALGALAHGKIDLGPALSPTSGSEIPHPQEIVFGTNAEVENLVREAEKNFDELVGEHDLHVQHYEGYGKALIKTHGVSPDAWAQMTKHLAYYKMFGRLAPTYESAQTRKFKLGRTEVIRSASNEALAFVKAMVESPPSLYSNPSLQGKLKHTPQHTRDLLKQAAARHMKYAGWAADAQGVDRHLFGLKKLVRTEEGEKVPKLYEDEAYARSSHWELSTSQLSCEWFDGWGYGEVVPDGYGLSYSIGDEYIRWTITSKKRKTEVLKHYLAEAATEIRDMMEAARKADAQAAVAGGEAQKTAKL
ncbi:hypothetical protein H0H92_013519 [Tricholoma furcatifolium]|nr:hypothetical protein H0H92_013519 [Tricholoma furcatifolium]